jgi:purine-binding chemotaxis protein CheW
MAEINRAEIHQYLTFKLADELYAINVANIKEVLSVPKLTKVPRMPDFMSGIINLRGSVVPVLDLCKKFALGETSFTVDTGIIVTEIDTARDDGSVEQLIIGIFSDEVQKVVTIEPGDIEPPPKIGISIDTTFIQGMGHVDGNFIIILNINKILTGSEMQVLQENTVEAAK